MPSVAEPKAARNRSSLCLSASSASLRSVMSRAMPSMATTFPRPVVDRPVALLGPDQGAVLAVPAQHERLFGEAPRVLQQMPVFGMDPLEAEVRIGVVLLGAVAGHLGRRWAHVLEAGVGRKR